MDEAVSSHHRLFAAALARADWTRQQLWMDYVSLGGIYDAFTLDAYLAGLLPWSAAEQDVLAIAVNERLYDLYLADRVPFQLVDEPPLAAAPAHVVQTLQDLLRDQPAPEGS